MKTGWRLLPVALAGVALAAPALAQQGGGGKPMSQADKQFLDYAARDNQAEIQICLLAEKKAQSLAIKAFARLMVDDHVQVESQLAAVVNATPPVAVPNGVGEDGRRTLAQLTPLGGPDFDRVFITDQIKDHGGDVQKYGRELQSTQDPTIRRFAAMTLPILQQHLQLAEAVRDAMQGGNPGGAADTSAGGATRPAVGQQ